MENSTQINGTAEPTEDNSAAAIEDPIETLGHLMRKYAITFLSISGVAFNLLSIGFQKH